MKVNPFDPDRPYQEVDIEGDYPEIDLDGGPQTLRPRDFALDRGGFRLREGMVGLDVRWEQLWQIRLVEPCPCFQVEWRHVGGRSDQTFVPRFRSEREEVESAVIALVGHVREHRPHALEPGWSAYPDVEWERVKELPEQQRSVGQHGQGVYRAAHIAPEERVVATWGPPSPFGSMLQWLASTPDRPWRQHPRRVAVTERFVYAERRDGTVARLPLESLRLRRGADDAVYVFGRKTALVLPAGSHDEGAREALDQRLSRDG